MRILIDNQKVIEVSSFTAPDPNDSTDTHTVLDFRAAHELIVEWQQLDPGHRDFRYGRDESDSEPSTIILAWVDANGALQMADVDPFWDGTFTQNAYSLDVLSGNIGCPLEWEPA